MASTPRFWNRKSQFKDFMRWWPQVWLYGYQPYEMQVHLRLSSQSDRMQKIARWSSKSASMTMSCHEWANRFAPFRTPWRPILTFIYRSTPINCQKQALNLNSEWQEFKMLIHSHPCTKCFVWRQPGVFHSHVMIVMHEWTNMSYSNQKYCCKYYLNTLRWVHVRRTPTSTKVWQPLGCSRLWYVSALVAS
jgi:hypothetical protein